QAARERAEPPPIEKPAEAIQQVPRWQTDSPPKPMDSRLGTRVVILAGVALVFALFLATRIGPNPQPVSSEPTRPTPAPPVASQPTPPPPAQPVANQPTPPPPASPV